ncbi:hypothetical protein F965_00622 [Acinetobacter schindleri NIPH 900]|uniref:Uncharacterized protein n=2 Tax=Moraxellaceae TaxID=468 RepID=N8Y3Z5_9GAMM|nr:hypothetical protein F965_00622 [Acinetobacter schindleri NIPH 900]MCU4323548.1 superinfection exclusion B family protein [Acinetobacter schindleri]OIJ38069.1 hypothetical protein BK820_07425 [Acinetobacter sp. LCT-H3]POU26331.1 hypothetical protein C3420_03570 [Acinetobacter sp. ACNIH3]
MISYHSINFIIFHTHKMKSSFQKANSIFLIFVSLIFAVSTLEIDPNLSQFVNSYFTFLLIIFLISLSFLIYDLIVFLKRQKEQRDLISKLQKEFINSLTKLSYEEKNILSLFMDGKVQEKSLNSNDQAVAWLEAVKFIYNTGRLEGNKKIYRIEPTLSKYLMQNPNTLY